LYDLATDPGETTDLIARPDLAPLVEHLSATALLHRDAGGHRLAQHVASDSVRYDWAGSGDSGGQRVEIFVSAASQGSRLSRTAEGLGVSGGESDAVDGGEALLVSFDSDVLVESAAIAAGDGSVGGFYQVGARSPLAIYCVDGDIDHRDQSGILSDIGLLRAGETLRFDSSPHYGTESSGAWRLRALTVRVVQPHTGESRP
jgi:hypothetical protein